MDTTFQEKNKQDLDKVVTLGVLLEFTDEFLIPKMGEMMDEKIGASEKRMIENINSVTGKLNHDLKVYID